MTILTLINKVLERSNCYNTVAQTWAFVCVFLLRITLEKLPLKAKMINLQNEGQALWWDHLESLKGKIVL